MEKYDLTYTKGPWNVKSCAIGQNGYHSHKIYSNDGKCLIATLPARNPFLFDGDKGNVRLIQYAPEMFEMLKMICQMMANVTLCDVNAHKCETCHIHILLKRITDNV